MAQMRELMFHFKGTINAEDLQKILFHLVMGGYSPPLAPPAALCILLNLHSKYEAN